jgi:SHS family lactate transporter-like MFS transporter
MTQPSSPVAARGADYFTASPVQPAEKGHRAAVIASFLGWTLDAFDFFIVAFTLTAIGKEFGQTDKAMALSITLTLAFRPIGAFVFGLMADRWGRRIPLMINLVFYSVVQVATGFTHSYMSFLVLRALFGIGMGGEWGVGASLAMEKAPAHRRGIFSGFLQEGYAVGNLLAAICFFVVFPRWGWRPMFYIGALPALLTLYVRSHVTESETWERSRQSAWHRSWRAYGNEIISHWKLFLYLVFFLAMMGFVSHGTQDMYPTFLQRAWHFDPRTRAVITMVSNVGGIVGGIAFGYYSDLMGRRRSIITALIIAIACIPLWAFAPTAPVLIFGAFVLQFMVQGAWGVVPAHINELSPNSVRGFLPGFAYQCGILIAGSVVYIEPLLAEHMAYAKAMAATAVLVFAGGAIATWLGRERRGVLFSEI